MYFYGTVTLELSVMSFRVYPECGNKIGILMFLYYVFFKSRAHIFENFNFL